MVVFMPLEINICTVPQLKCLKRSLEPFTRHGCGSISTNHHNTLKSTHYSKPTLKPLFIIQHDFQGMARLGTLNAFVL